MENLYEIYYTCDNLSGYSMEYCSNCSLELPSNILETSKLINKYAIHKYTGEIKNKAIIECPKCKCKLIIPC